MIISMAKSSENYPAISQKIKLQKTIILERLAVFYMNRCLIPSWPFNLISKIKKPSTNQNEGTGPFT